MFDKNIDTIDQEHSGDLYCDLPYRFSIATVVNKNVHQAQNSLRYVYVAT